MTDAEVIKYIVNDPIEINLSYMPFIHDGGLFIPTDKTYGLGDKVTVDLQLPGKKEIKIEGKVIWITPKNALHHVLPGVGIQFIGDSAASIRAKIEAELDAKMEIGGYTYGITDEAKKK